MEENFTLEATIPTCQYGNIHAKIEGKGGNFDEFRDSYMPEIETMFKRYSETPIKFSDGVFVKVETFTGETILYDTLNHKYKDLNGNHLINASEYKEKFSKPFDKEKVSEATAKSWGCSPKDLRDCWERNAKMSNTFGTSIHAVMEQYWKYKDKDFNGNTPYLSKNPILKNAALTFPEQNQKGYSEIFISDVKNGKVGQADRLVVLDEKKKIAIIDDYKTDADLKPDKLKLHFIQESYYASILITFGWTIEKVRIWNYIDGRWELHESPVLDLGELEKELTKPKK